MGLLDGIISGSVKLGYWDGEYHKGRTKTIEEAKEYLKDKKNNYIDIEIKRSKRKDDGKVEKICGSLFTSVLNKSWNSLRYLRCKKTADENIRRSLLNREFRLQEMKEEGVNKRPTLLELYIDFNRNVTEEEALEIIKEAILRNGNTSLNKYTTVYAGSVEGEAMGLDKDITCKYYKLREILKNKLLLPYPILVGRRELFK